MVEKYILPGDKVELNSLVNVILPDDTRGKKVYKTSVYDVHGDGKIEFLMPIEQTKLILLPINGEYEVCFHSGGIMYKADVRVVERKKNNGKYTFVVEMISSLCKFQRREYYRLNCVFEVMVKEMVEGEEEQYTQGFFERCPKNLIKSGVIVDISGGGLRFISKYPYEKDKMLFLGFELSAADKVKRFEIPSTVIFCKELENRKNEYEVRVKYDYIDKFTREEIIKYIFDEERKIRKNGKG